MRQKLIFANKCNALPSRLRPRSHPRPPPPPLKSVVTRSSADFRRIAAKSLSFLTFMILSGISGFLLVVSVCDEDGLLDVARFFRLGLRGIVLGIWTAGGGGGGLEAFRAAECMKVNPNSLQKQVRFLTFSGVHAKRDVMKKYWVRNEGFEVDHQFTRILFTGWQSLQLAPLCRLGFLSVSIDPLLALHAASRFRAAVATGCGSGRGMASMAKRSIGDLTATNLKGKKVFLRADLNVPLDENQHITDDTGVRAAIPTIKHSIENGASVILSSPLNLRVPLTGETFKNTLSPT
ncbi:phosphoglycerate kinase, chloroplastic [Cinnamomum micranthum f. kanehirae]|uniref:Phosphoglycerate kinase n=1 Tax=Cinnamomum micranthum f. kanehirae TaxID=337451 RepID=A0A443PN02_9MAGN|nr:phosphoglycerate kinase, chloroplastic [Cinnamomum micranthum f. kanehirae]